MSSIDLTFERSLYVGGQITGILYGIHLVIFVLSCRLMSRPPYSSKSDSRFCICFYYGLCLLILWTVALSCNAIFGQFAWIDHRDVEGGPAAYIAEHISDLYNTLGTTAGVGMNLLADALLVFRYLVLLEDNGFPCHNLSRHILYVASRDNLHSGELNLPSNPLAMSLLLIYESARPGANFFKGHAVAFGVPYMALTISLNIIVTLLICSRLIAVKNRLQNTLGPHHARMYTGVNAIMVESAAPFTILGIIYLITYARHSPTSIAFVQVWGDFCALSPQLIVLRVAMGHAWSKDTSEQLTSTHMSFASSETTIQNVPLHKHPDLEGSSV
ncbi:hypothetical protein AAF712_009839 [Marasmius tenuissimus]|uniref:Uncharacterized protein n=1 Tax=Marasmius tenuissimus TaxID=585030 RepID=A0ABR2ZSC7_9AGAR